MMSGLLARVYGLSPVWLQHAEISAFGLVWKRRRFGGRFRGAIEEFTARERFTAADWRDYQTKALRQLLAHARQSVPHYRDSFLDAGLRAADLDAFTPDEMTALPVVTKEHLRRSPRAFVAATVNPRKLHAYHTSGTTGTPLAIQFTDGMHQIWSAAYEARVRRWAGVHWRMSRAMIGGRMVVPGAEAKPPYWRHNVVEGQLYMSAFHITPSTAPAYVKALNRFRPGYLMGYASSHFFLARMILEQGLEVHQPRAVLTSSETLTPEMRDTIERAYRCAVFDSYSGVESCALASECEFHQLHLSPDVGVVEIVGADGRPCAPGEAGEIVATGFLNHAQPLIRYRTGDWAVATDEPCRCGRGMPMLRQLIGRLEDTVIGADGREMVRFHGLFVGVPHVREGQVIQESLSAVRIRVTADPDFNDADRACITSRVRERLGEIDLRIERVDCIERTERGKFRAVISHVTRRPYAAAVNPPLSPPNDLVS